MHPGQRTILNNNQRNSSVYTHVEQTEDEEEETDNHLSNQDNNNDNDGSIVVLPSDTTTPNNPHPPTASNRDVFVLGIVSSLGFCCTYFWRYPIFMLPEEILNESVFGGNNKYFHHLDLQDCFSLAYIGGFGISKGLGIQLISSPFFFQHRLYVLYAIVWSSMLLEGVGVYIFSSNKIKVLFVFLSSMISSWIYGAMITYLEGRNNTEFLFAFIMFLSIVSSGISRFVASYLLQHISLIQNNPLGMPLTIGIVMALVCSILLYATEQQPKPTREDLQSRCSRTSMTKQQQILFFKTYVFLLLPIYMSYSLLTSIRSFRDFYSEQIYTSSWNHSSSSSSSSNGGEREVPSWVYFITDIPAAIISSMIIYSFQNIMDHYSAIIKMMNISILSGFLVMMSTYLFSNSYMGGFLWQILLGIGLYIPYSILTTAIHERLIAATKTVGTCTFLIFFGDCCAYVVTISILLVRDFGSIKNSTTTNEDDTKNSASSILNGFIHLIYTTMGIGIICLIAAQLYIYGLSNRVDSNNSNNNDDDEPHPPVVAFRDNDNQDDDDDDDDDGDDGIINNAGDCLRNENYPNEETKKEEEEKIEDSIPLREIT